MANNSFVRPKKVAAEADETYTLSPEQLKYYSDNGFLVIKGLVDYPSLYAHKQRFLQVCKGLVPRGQMSIAKEKNLRQKNANPEDYVNKVQDVLYDDVFIQYAHHPKLLGVLKQLIGRDIMGIHSMFINKPPGTGEHPPHQDLYYFPFRPAEKIVASWTAVDHVTLNNGCLYVIPGSHKTREIFPHGDVKTANLLYHGIIDEAKVAPKDKRVHLEMSPGDTVFFNPYLVHGSGPNVSKNYRKAITFHFANSNCHCVDVVDTVQATVARDMEEEAKRRGFDINFVEIWKYKSRQITGEAKSKL